MIYPTTILIAVPVSMLTLAAKMAQAFDPDVGGAKSFDTLRATNGTTTYAVSYSPATELFAQQAVYFKANPADLHAAVVADYTARWASLTPPTLTECQTFCAGCFVVANTGLDDGLASVGLTRVVE